MRRICSGLISAIKEAEGLASSSGSVAFACSSPLMSSQIRLEMHMLTADLERVARFKELRARTADEDRAEAVEELRTLARHVRLSDLEMITRAQLGHIGGDYSVTDVLVTLYGAVLNI